jgi:hypothetical protein
MMKLIIRENFKISNKTTIFLIPITMDFKIQTPLPPPPSPSPSPSLPCGPPSKEVFNNEKNSICGFEEQKVEHFTELV